MYLSPFYSRSLFVCLSLFFFISPIFFFFLICVRTKFISHVRLQTKPSTALATKQDDEGVSESSFYINTHNKFQTHDMHKR